MLGIHGGDIYRNEVILDFSVNINPLGMPEGVENALCQAIKNCNSYPDIEAAKLKKQMASMFAIPEKFLLFGNGASELFMGILHAIRPKKVLLPIPSFYGYEYAAKAVESEIVYIPLREEDAFLPKEDFLEALTEDIELLFLASPNNPTGRLLDKSYLKKVLEICEEKNIIVVLDECFIEFCGNAYSMLSEIDQYKNLLLVRAFTKIYAIPGVRLGYLIGSNTTLLENIARQLPEWNLSTFAQEAGISCLNQWDYLEKTINIVKQERAFLSEKLKELGIQVFESEANFLLIHSEVDLYEKLLHRGILIRNCENFNGLSKGYVRIAVKLRNENETLWKAIGECIE